MFLLASQQASAAFPIRTDQGYLTGRSFPWISEYLGIPYAAPPVGSLRWMPPQQPSAFKGLFKATSFGNQCTQSNGPDGTKGSEDCLYLNVYVPTGPQPWRGFPVMFWIHGGGFAAGAGNGYDPTEMAEIGRVIVVTINYRLGFMGFFAQTALDAEGHEAGNYGLMDQQLALRWVQRNIGSFGGDRGNVTIFGESAGGFSVLSHLASPTATGLFKKAIEQSGGYAHYQDYLDPISVIPLADAETKGTSFVPSGAQIAKDVNCSDQTAACLRAVPAASFVQYQRPILFPFVDGTLLTQTPSAAFTSGSFNHVPIITGTNHDEGRYFVALIFDLRGGVLEDENYPNVIALVLAAGNVDDPIVKLLLSKYPLSDYPPPAGYSLSAPLALGAMVTDGLFACTTRNADLELANYVPDYAYEFNDETAPSFLPPSPPLSFPLGDAHGIELQYLFDLSALGVTPDFTPDQQALSDTMIAYWTQFAKYGNPNGFGLPYWPTYNFSGRFESLIAPRPVTETDASFDADHQCSSFWNTF